MLIRALRCRETWTINQPRSHTCLSDRKAELDSLPAAHSVVPHRSLMPSFPPCTPDRSRLAPQRRWLSKASDIVNVNSSGSNPCGLLQSCGDRNVWQQADQEEPPQTPAARGSWLCPSSCRRRSSTLWSSAQLLRQCPEPCLMLNLLVQTTSGLNDTPSCAKCHYCRALAEFTILVWPHQRLNLRKNRMKNPCIRRMQHHACWAGDCDDMVVTTARPCRLAVRCLIVYQSRIASDRGRHPPCMQFLLQGVLTTCSLPQHVQICRSRRRLAFSLYFIAEEAVLAFGTFCCRKAENYCDTAIPCGSCVAPGAAWHLVASVFFSSLFSSTSFRACSRCRALESQTP